jgi:hypothetical protein
MPKMQKPIIYAGAARRFAKMKHPFKVLSDDAGTTVTKPDLNPADNNPEFSTTVSEPDLAKLVKRVVTNSVNAKLEIRPGVAFRMEEKHDNAFALNPPYGILPFLTSASPEELIAAADALAAAKYEFTRQGNYYSAWQCGWRERMVERILAGITNLGITSVP